MPNNRDQSSDDCQPANTWSKKIFATNWLLHFYISRRFCVGSRNLSFNCNYSIFFFAAIAVGAFAFGIQMTSLTSRDFRAFNRNECAFYQLIFFFHNQFACYECATAVISSVVHLSIAWHHPYEDDVINVILKWKFIWLLDALEGNYVLVKKKNQNCIELH